MIVFDGVDISAVAPVRIEDIRVSPLSLNPVARERAVSGGADFVRMRDGTRTVAVTFALLDDDPVTRAQSLIALKAWAKRDKEYMMQLSHVPGMCLYCTCTAFPEPSVRQWWESKLRLTFTCYDNPYWTSIGETSVACGTQIYVAGDAPPLMRIERTLAEAASNQTYSDGTHSMTFSTLPAGDLVIDLNRQTAAVDGVSVMQYYNYTNRFLVPVTGAQTITGTGTIKYRERWA